MWQRLNGYGGEWAGNWGTQRSARGNRFEVSLLAVKFFLFQQRLEFECLERVFIRIGVRYGGDEGRYLSFLGLDLFVKSVGFILEMSQHRLKPYGQFSKDVGAHATNTHPERTAGHALVLRNLLHRDRIASEELHLLLEPDDIPLERTNVTTPLIMG